MPASADKLCPIRADVYLLLTLWVYIYLNQGGFWTSSISIPWAEYTCLVPAPGPQHKHHLGTRQSTHAWFMPMNQQQQHHRGTGQSTHAWFLGMGQSAHAWFLPQTCRSWSSGGRWSQLSPTHPPLKQVLQAILHFGNRCLMYHFIVFITCSIYTLHLVQFPTS